MFDWQRLAENGIGLWPDDGPEGSGDWQTLMAQYGYDVRDPEATLRAFRRHFEPEALGKPASEETKRRVSRLIAASKG